ncbi:hypothetical protein STANM309S_06377 [Streptomyces tanashiensis]
MTPSTGWSPKREIRTDSPISMTPSSAPSATSARIARRAAGARNDGTALAIASTPVNAEQPEANAFSRSKAPTVVALSARTEACPSEAAVETGASRNSPTAIMTRIAPTKTAVGTMNARAESTIPRRFTAVMSTRTPRQITSRSP